VKPSDCTIAFAIPTSVAEFRAHIADPENHEFARKVSLKERCYEYAVIRAIIKATTGFKALGFNVATQVTLARFVDLCSIRPTGVVILIAHWNEHSVEFYDRFFGVTEIVTCIPSSFEGVLDLCVCHPKELADKIRMARENIKLIRFSTSVVTLRVWLWFYLAVGRELAETGGTYLQAVDSVLAAFAHIMNLKLKVKEKNAR
jgi:hypothetical protein